MAAAATILISRLPATTATVTRCSALPYLPPRLSSTSSFSTSLKHFPEFRKSLLQTRATSSEETSTSVDGSELFTDLKEKARSFPLI
ncbi:protein CURVATURE THYLAKOID 1A, chloroplastic-like [Senna tora]|uniref:Protein CURVATURE THYLAKOID 1A, chloroplastic-like n=1 Tax=Senna tora TaxID=362788 RepID=A0A834TQI3_9FABA|nr:protein CURVATURE THYLAKOID 1A, chloroplastic-like [Senna tora]